MIYKISKYSASLLLALVFLAASVCSATHLDVHQSYSILTAPTGSQNASLASSGYDIASTHQYRSTDEKACCVFVATLGSSPISKLAQLLSWLLPTLVLLWLLLPLRFCVPFRQLPCCYPPISTALVDKKVLLTC